MNFFTIIKKYRVPLTHLLIISVVCMPLFALAWVPGNAGLIPCGTKATHDKACNFNDFLQLLKNIMDFLIFISIPIAACLFAWAGFKMLMSPGKAGARDEAKKMFGTVVWGIVIMLTAWVVIHTIAAALVAPAFYQQFFGR